MNTGSHASNAPSLSTLKSKPGASQAYPIVRLWEDKCRKEQRARIGALHLQSCDKEGLQAWKEAERMHAQLPSHVRIDLPSPRAFARVLGLYRTVGMLKHRAIEQLEMSVLDIAHALQYSKTVVEAVLRWLGEDVILYRGHQVARGLGYLRRTKRKAKAFVHGVLKNVYRTTQTGLTPLGRALVGLVALAERLKRTCRRFVRTQVQAQTTPRKRSQPPTPVADVIPQWDKGLAMLRRIREEALQD